MAQQVLAATGRDARAHEGHGHPRSKEGLEQAPDRLRPALSDVLRMVEVQRLQVRNDAGAELAVVFVGQKMIHHPVGVALVFGNGVAKARRGHRGRRPSITAGSASTATGGSASMSIFTPAIVGATFADE